MQPQQTPRPSSRVSPAQALRALSSACARHRAQRPLPAWISSVLALVITALIALTVLTYLAVPGERLLAVVFLGLSLVAMVASPALIGRSTLRQEEHEQAHNALLLIVKDQADRLDAADLLHALRVLPDTTPAPLPALLRARLAEKLPFTSAEEMESLSAEDRAWLREALSTPETEESLTVAILLARGTAPDPAARGAIALLAESGKTERIREAARDSLRARAL